jgi:hypothetical protein
MRLKIFFIPLFDNQEKSLLLVPVLHVYIDITVYSFCFTCRSVSFFHWTKLFCSIFFLASLTNHI